jgi:hypothetical protein
MTAQVFGYFADLHGVQFVDGGTSCWIHAMKPGQYIHQRYGKIDIDAARIQKFADSVAKNVRGIPLDIDYDHKAHTGEAAGWVKQAEARTDGLWLFVDWTSAAAQKIKDKAYRFFSPEFDSEWIDASGAKHNDVLFGGGITNRPFLKNLLPLNLSELSFGPEPPAPPVPPTKEKEVEIKQLAELLGLPADSEEGVVLAEFKKRLTPPEPPKEEPPKFEPFKLSEELRQLAESSPAAKQLVTMVEGLMQANTDNSVKLKEQIVTIKLGELDRSNLALTPVAKDLVHDLAMSLSEDHQEKLWKLVESMRDSNAFVVELGERGRSGGGYTRDKSPVIKFDEAVQAYVTGAEKMLLPDAMERVAKENPDLYNAYRGDTYITGGRQ